MLPPKVFPLSASQYYLRRFSGRWVVLCHGVFDLVHPGHLEHLRQAKAMGPEGCALLVSITADDFVAKGPGRPAFDQQRRAEFLAALEIVDAVTIVEAPTAVPVIRAIRPEIYCKGPDYENRAGGNFALERAAVEACGGRVAFTTGFISSSTSLLNQNMPVLGETQRAFMESIKAKYSLNDIDGWLDKCQGLNALVTGEPMKDVYHHMEPLGMSPKDSLVTWRQTGLEQWDGGSRVITEHLRGIGLSVELDFGDMPPIVKHRYLWGPQHGKVFAQVEGEDGVRPMRRCRPACQINVIADYGHGLISPDFAGSLVREPSEWVAVMCQSNSSNWGFNLLTKYPRADYVVADELELRLACHDRIADLEYLVKQQAERMGTGLFAVTLGHRGCVVYGGGGFSVAPALANRVVDRLGSGDAFLAATAPLAYVGAPADIVALMGNLAGAIEVGAVGQEVLDMATLRRWLKGVMA